MTQALLEGARGPLPLLPGGYTVDGSDPDVLVLRRADGSFVSAFSSRGVRREGLREAVEEDLKGWEACERMPRAFAQWRVSSRGDEPESSPEEAGSGSTQIARPPRGAGQPTRPLYWLIVRPGFKDVEILTIGGAGKGSTLLLFGFEAGATEFCRWYTTGSGWRVRPIGLGELLSLLREPCAEAECVALDPSPEIAAEGAISLVSLPRQSFVDSLVGRGRSWFEDHYHKEGKPHG